MSMRLTCPGCGRSLLLPDDCTAELLSCPRCLANIPNPRTAPDSLAVQTTPSPPPAGAPPSGVRRAEDWLPSPSVDVDVRRDNHRTGPLSFALAILGGIGVSIALLGSFGAAIGDASFGLLRSTMVALVVLTLLSAFTVIGSRPSPTIGANIGRTVLRLLTITGAIIAIGSLLVAAMFIFALVVCLSNGGKC